MVITKFWPFKKYKAKTNTVLMDCWSVDIAGGWQLLNYDEVFNQASATSCTVYCGEIPTDLTGEQYLV